MKHFVSISIFFIIAIVAWWSITEDFSDTQPVPIKSKDYAEIFMNEFEMTAMNEDGTPGFILNGSHLTRNVGSDDTNVQQPVFQLLKQENQWHIIAETAIINDKKETVELNDNVVMSQKNTVPAVVIRTQNMMIHTDTQIAHTESLVELTRGESRVRSNGMIFDNKTSELELLSDVNGYYQPHD